MWTIDSDSDSGSVPGLELGTDPESESESIVHIATKMESLKPPSKTIKGKAQKPSNEFFHVDGSTFARITTPYDQYGNRMVCVDMLLPSGVTSYEATVNDDGRKLCIEFDLPEFFMNPEQYLSCFGYGKNHSQLHHAMRAVKFETESSLATKKVDIDMPFQVETELRARVARESDDAGFSSVVLHIELFAVSKFVSKKRNNIKDGFVVHRSPTTQFNNAAAPPSSFPDSGADLSVGSYDGYKSEDCVKTENVTSSTWMPNLNLLGSKKK